MYFNLAHFMSDFIDGWQCVTDNQTVDVAKLCDYAQMLAKESISPKRFLQLWQCFLEQNPEIDKPLIACRIFKVILERIENIHMLESLDFLACVDALLYCQPRINFDCFRKFFESAKEKSIDLNKSIDFIQYIAFGLTSFDTITDVNNSLVSFVSETDSVGVERLSFGSLLIPSFNNPDFEKSTIIGNKWFIPLFNAMKTDDFCAYLNNACAQYSTRSWLDRDHQQAHIVEKCIYQIKKWPPSVLEAFDATSIKDIVKFTDHHASTANML